MGLARIRSDERFTREGEEGSLVIVADRPGKFSEWSCHGEIVRNREGHVRLHDSARPPAPSLQAVSIETALLFLTVDVPAGMIQQWLPSASQYFYAGVAGMFLSPFVFHPPPRV